MTARTGLLAAYLLFLLFGACTPLPPLLPAADLPSATLEPADTFTSEPIPTFTPSPSQTWTPEPPPTSTVTPSVTPTYAVLRGRVNVERLSCRYGPGAMYLYLYGLLQGANQEIVGRTDTGAWLLTRARGDTTLCWARADYLDVQGDLTAVEVVYPEKYRLPVSPYYPPLTGVSAVRSGDQVTISWNPVSLRAGDEENPNSPLYVAETWVCRGGRVVFTPVGAFRASVTVTDEAGCAEPSWGRVFLAEKHGYAGPSAVPWPPHP
jgi:hypothetical protein